ncbi:type II secretion system F family protein [Mycolicibacterium mengxianglii]|uniref:type II secretion system F family protein n=1 Tax=Mycolicibacterium mengxianglii TaxID=2736649 RepID=UPI0018EED56E|nr:type II secretion system F family protein [Mycolicibacterium mengxianglii]
MNTALLLAAAALMHPVPGRRLPLTRTPRTYSPARFLVVTGIALSALVAVSLPATTAVSAMLIAGTAYLRRRRHTARRRAHQEGRALGGALEMLTAELRAGAHPVRAFEVAAAETASGPGGVSTGLRTVAARAGLGADVAAGLRAAAAQSALPRQWERLAACWQLASEHGLPIGVLMRAAQLDIGERQRYTAQVDAGMAGARATAAILAVLPVLGVGLGELLGAAPTAFLSHGIGGWVLIVGVLLVCAGVMWSGRITDRLPV